MLALYPIRISKSVSENVKDKPNPQLYGEQLQYSRNKELLKGTISWFTVQFLGSATTLEIR